MWLVGVVNRRQVWLVDGMYGCGYQEVGVVSGCCVRRPIDFLIIITYSYSTCISSFLQQHPYFFVHF